MCVRRRVNVALLTACDRGGGGKKERQGEVVVGLGGIKIPEMMAEMLAL